MARNKVKFVPLSIDDKARVLRKLQQRPHFEKILTWTSTPFRSNPRRKVSCTLLMPAWFVHKHGDKVREFIILRTETSTKVWPVTLEISILSPKCSTVRFSRGWKAFATSHGLLEGDSLVFALTTVVSEFEVYVFRSCTNNRDAAANAKVKLAADPKKKMAVIAKKELDSLQTDIRKHITCPSFVKRLTTTNVARGPNCYFEIPSAFMKLHGSRIHSVVNLQGMREQSPVQSMECRKFRCQRERYFFGAEWRVFAAENHLQVGQELLFTLLSDSFFIVRDAALPIPPSVAHQKPIHVIQDDYTSSSNFG